MKCLIILSGTLLGAMTLSLGLASTAGADPAPPPSGDDVNSYGTIGDAQNGFSLGKDGYRVSAGGTTLTSSGWPVSRTQITSPFGNYDATTDYNSTGEGSIEHWSKLDSPSVGFNNWAELYYNGKVTQDANVRIGSMQYVCHDFGCKMVP